MAKNAVLNLSAFEAPDYLKDTEDAAVEEIPAEQFKAFAGHPFSIREESEEMEALAESVGENGILVPVLARPAGGGMYEIISGHRRLHAAHLAGLKKIPAIIREMDDDQAVIAMVHSNQYRENIPVSEKSHAYRMCFEAEKHQGKKTGSETAETVANGSESRRTVYRLIRLSYLNEALLQMVDAKRIVMGGQVLNYLI